MTKRPHNNLFEFIFTQKDITQDLIKYLLPSLHKKIDIHTLSIDNTSYVDEQLEDFRSDIVYNALTKSKNRVKVALLLEHKSTPPTIPRLQLLDYMRGIWNKDTAPNKDGEKSKKKKMLTNVIPIIFYHGKEKWHKKPFEAHFGNFDDELTVFIPKFEYYLIDLSNYSDEFILNIKAGFLINSLLTFKHKNETEYIKKYFARIFVNLEEKADEESTKQFTRRITAYLVITTKLSSKDVIELMDQLPSKTKDTVMTGYESILLEGIQKGEKIGIQKGERIGIQKGEKIGIQKGEKIGIEKKKIEVAIKLLNTQMQDDMIINISGIDKSTLLLLRLNADKKFEDKAAAMLLAKHLVTTFPYFSNELIATFSKLPVEAIYSLKA